MTKAQLYEKACMLPLLPGVYIIRDKEGTIIYIGKAKRLRTRVSQYFREGVPHDAKVTRMIENAYEFDVIVCQSEFEALVLEASQIKAHTPKYNILLKDDKGYSYVRVTREAYPRLSAVLQKEEDGAEYIGPFTSSFAVREMVQTAQDCFQLPRCNRRFPEDIGKGRPCLNAHIGKCMGLCSGKISREAYNEAVAGAVHMIRYGKKEILKTLEERMTAAAERLDFEQAALIRDQLAAIRKVSEGQKVVVDERTQMDVIALAATTRAVCAAVLRYRRGRLADKREFVFHDTADADGVREEFLSRYYLDGEEIPRTIAVDALPEDAEALQQLLEQTRGAKVHLYVPQKGDVAKLVTMAYTNAVERLARESGRYGKYLACSNYPECSNIKSEGAEISSTKCPKCGANMVVKSGKFGKFLACPNYPECNATLPFDSEISKEKCPTCGSLMYIRNGKNGKYLSCPKCNTNRPIAEEAGVCPVCGAPTRRMKSKAGKIFYSCSAYPKCKFMSWEQPTGEKCPKCGKYLIKKGKKILCSSCDFSKDAPEAPQDGAAKGASGAAQERPSEDE